MTKLKLYNSEAFHEWRAEMHKWQSCWLYTTEQKPSEYPCLLMYKVCDDEYGNFVVYDFVYVGDI